MFIRQDWMSLAHVYHAAYLRAGHDEIRRLVKMGYRPAEAIDIVCDSFEMV